MTQALTAEWAFWRVSAATASLPTAIIAGNDRCALGILHVFTSAGIDIPGEVSLGYDDSRLSDNPRIDLTTIHQDAEGLARAAVAGAVGMLGCRRRCCARAVTQGAWYHRAASRLTSTETRTPTVARTVGVLVGHR